MITSSGKGKSALAGFCACCVLVSGSALADGEPRGSFDVLAVGLPNGYVTMEYQAPVIRVSREDAARGRVRIAQGTRFVVTTRSPGRYVAHFAVRAPLIRSVRIEGIAADAATLREGGGRVLAHESPAGRHVVSVGYQFQLSPDAVPGTYPWPLEMVVRAAGPGEADAPRTISELVLLGGPARR